MEGAHELMGYDETCQKPWILGSCTGGRCVGGVLAHACLAPIDNDKALTCPEGQSAWALAPSLFGEKETCSLQEKFALVLLLRPRATWSEKGLNRHWKMKRGSLTAECVTESLIAMSLVCLLFDAV